MHMCRRGIKEKYGREGRKRLKSGKRKGGAKKG